MTRPATAETRNQKPSTMPAMENNARDYYAPFGMSSFDFNSLIRRRYLDDLIEMLREKGILHRQIAGTGLFMVKEQAEQAQTQTAAETPTKMTANVAFRSPVTVVAEIDNQPRPVSPVYSRDIDGNSYCSASAMQDFSSRSASFGSLLPPLMSMQNSGESSTGTPFLGSIDPEYLFPAAVEVSNRDYNIGNPSASYPHCASVASLVPAPLNVPRSGEYGGDSRRCLAKAEKISMIVQRRTPDRKSNSSNRATDSPPALASQGTSKGSSSRTSLSSPAKCVSSSATSATSASNIGTACEGSNEKPPWPLRVYSAAMNSFRPRSVTGSDTPQDQERSCGNLGQQTEDYSSAALFELQQRYKQQHVALRDRHPDFHHLVAWGRLCRKICSLDFDHAEMVLVASDMTTCMQVRIVQFWGDRARVDVDLLELVYAKNCQDCFRTRLSRRVHRRIACLQLQAQYGSVRKIEDWYREVVDAIGWRDDEEAQLPWSWREHGSYL